MGLNIKVKMNRTYKAGVLDIVQNNGNKEGRKHSYQLVSLEEWDAFYKNVKENRRSYLIVEDNAIRQIELLVDEKGEVTFRYPERERTIEVRTTIDDIKVNEV